MNIFLIIYTVLIVVFILTSIFTFSLSRKNVEKELNLKYILLAATLIIHLVIAYNLHFTSSIEKQILLEKLSEFSIVLAGIFFLRFFSSLTGFAFSKLLIPYSLIILSLILFLPYGIKFSSINSINEIQFFWGERIFISDTNTSPFSIIVVIFIILLLIYVYKAINHLRKMGDAQFSKLLLICINMAVCMVLLVYILDLAGIKGLTILRSAGVILFPLIVIYRNLTNLQKAKTISDNLIKSEERLRLVMQTANDGIWDWNTQTSSVYVNTRYYSMLDYDFNDFKLTFSEFKRIIFQEDFPPVIKQLDNLKKGEINKTAIEFRAYKKSGDLIWVLLKGEVVEYSSENIVLRVLGTIADITDLKNSVVQIKESENKFRTLFENSLEAYLLLEENLIIDCNQAALELFRGDKEEIINLPIDNFTSRQQPYKTFFNERSEYQITPLLADKESKIELKFKRFDGSEFMAELFLTYITLNSKNIVFTSIRDISDRINLVSNLNKQINSLNLVKEVAFVSSSNHDKEKVFASIKDLVSKYTSASRVSIITIDKKPNSHPSRKEISNKIAENELNLQELNHQINIKCIQEKKPIIINNCFETELIPSEFIEEYKIKSALAIPIISKSDVIGILRLDDNLLYNRFKDNELSLFSTVADQIALFLDNVDLYHNLSLDRAYLKFTNERLSLLSRISASVITTEPVKVQVNRYLELIKEVFQIDACILRIKNGNSLDLVTSIGFPQEHLAPSIGCNRGLPRLIFSSKRAIRINDMDTNPLTRKIEFKTPNVYELKSYAGAPVKIRGEISGIFALYNLIEKKHFTKTDLEHLQIIANHIGIIIENNKLYSDITDKKKQLEIELIERQKAQDELTKANRYIEFIVNTIPVSIMLIDNNLNVINYNFKSCSYLNENNKDSKAFNLMFPALEFALPKLKKSIEENIAINEKIMRSDENKEMKYYNLSVFPMKLEQVGGIVVMIEDITERFKIEQLIIQSEKMLSIAGLAAGLAHEINNPLGTIVQGCQNIQRRISLEIPKNMETAEKLDLNLNTLNTYFEQREIFTILDSVKNAAAKAAGIIRNMLQFSRRSESKMVSYSIEQLINEVLEITYNDYNLKKKFDIRSIKFILEIKNDLPKIKITVSEIQQVLFNILQNAAHAFKSGNKPKEPTIIIRAYNDSTYLIIEIEDNGQGISEKVKSRIFEPFFTTKEVGEGTGLGLSVSYMIIKELHKGEITVSSVVDKGTKFTIKLPLQSN